MGEPAAVAGHFNGLAEMHDDSGTESARGGFNDSPRVGAYPRG